MILMMVAASRTRGAVYAKYQRVPFPKDGMTSGSEEVLFWCGDGEAVHAYGIVENNKHGGIWSGRGTDQYG